MTTNPQYLAALQDFQRLRRRVALQSLLALSGKQPGLLSYQAVREQLRAIERPNIVLREIPISAIQGSVGRYADFTQDFLPKDNVDAQRWARVKTQFTSPEGVPPIEVYQIGEVYFVLDGNHRVSVAREMGNRTIEAYVREVKSRVPLKLDEDIDQFIIKAELAEFLEATQIDRLLPDIDLTVTAPGRYLILQQQIEAVHFALEREQNQAVPYDQAVKKWYSQVYDPIISIIHRQKILAQYPQRTETDLFVWIIQHRAVLVKALGWEITADSTLKDLTQTSRSNLEHLRQQARLLFRRITVRSLPDNSPVGTWRQEKLANPQGRLFGNVLAVIDGQAAGWQTLHQAVKIADLEGSQLFGLCIGPPGKAITTKEKKHLQTEFENICRAGQISGQLAFVTGEVAQVIADRACWADLVILPKMAVNEHLHELIQNCPTPLLILPEGRVDFQRALLAYNGSPKSEEALYLAAYLTIFWELALTVVTCIETKRPHPSSETIFMAQNYLESYAVRAQYIEHEGEPVHSVLKTAQEKAADLLLLGGYGHNPRTRPSIVDAVLANTTQAVMICR